jgi:uncharacterized membrane protein (UPF0127 family)
MKVYNKAKQTLIADKCEIADNFFTRFKGLMGKKELPVGFGLFIKPCNGIHMFFMKIPLDIIFIDKEGIVVYTIENIKPWQVSRIVKNAHSTIELPIGTISQSCTQVGDNLQLTHI